MSTYIRRVRDEGTKEVPHERCEIAQPSTFHRLLHHLDPLSSESAGLQAEVLCRCIALSRHVEILERLEREYMLNLDQREEGTHPTIEARWSGRLPAP